MSATVGSAEALKPRWQPVSAVERRILGVLIEKAKTVPESYPMTLNGICTGCNQKNNRYPLMQLEPEQLEEPLERLRSLGAIALVQGGGRTEKYRHYLNDWLGVEKAEIAVMAELLLRGAQTEGELRQRASRMEPINDLGALRDTLNSLRAKNLIVSLTPDGRGHVITHNLYEPQQLEKLRREFSAGGHAAAPDDDDANGESAAGTPQAGATSTRDLIESLRADVEDLKRQLQALRDEVAALR